MKVSPRKRLSRHGRDGSLSELLLTIQNEGFTPVDNDSRAEDCSYHLRSHIGLLQYVTPGILMSWPMTERVYRKESKYCVGGFAFVCRGIYV